MTDFKKIADEFQKFKGVPNPNFIQGKVMKVNETTVDIEDVNKIKYEGVLLQTTTETSGNFCILFPKKDTLVWCAALGKNNTPLSVIAINEVEKVHFKFDGLEFELNGSTGKIEIKNNQISLKDIFEDLASTLTSFKLMVPVVGSPTPVPSVSLEPSTALNIESFKLNFKKLLK
jgi:hypothetical protein